MYAVLVMQKYITVEDICGDQSSIKINSQGKIGAIPVFKWKKDAKVFAKGHKDWPIVKLRYYDDGDKVTDLRK